MTSLQNTGKFGPFKGNARNGQNQERNVSG